MLWFSLWLENEINRWLATLKSQKHATTLATMQISNSDYRRPSPASTRHCPNAGLMLFHRLPNSNSALGERLLFAGCHCAWLASANTAHNHCCQHSLRPLLSTQPTTIAANAAYNYCCQHSLQPLLSTQPITIAANAAYNHCCQHSLQLLLSTQPTTIAVNTAYSHRCLHSLQS